MLGMKLLDLRKANNMSQQELADKLGVKRQTISQWELEKTYPDIKTAKKIASLFDISIDELANNDFVSNDNIDSLKKEIASFKNKLDIYQKKYNLIFITMFIFQFFILIIQIILLIRH